jgi:hypothetical protein
MTTDGSMSERKSWLDGTSAVMNEVPSITNLKRSWRRPVRNDRGERSPKFGWSWWVAWQKLKTSEWNTTTVHDCLYSDWDCGFFAARLYWEIYSGNFPDYSDSHCCISLRVYFATDPDFPII